MRVDKGSEHFTTMAIDSSEVHHDEETASVTEREKEFIEEFSEIGDWLLQYEYLLYYIEDLHDIPEDERSDEIKVKGCVSNAWMRLSSSGGNVCVELTSDALIIKGILGVITAIIGGASVREIAAWEPTFIEKTPLRAKLGMDRQNGVASILSGIKKYAAKQTPWRDK